MLDVYGRFRTPTTAARVPVFAFGSDVQVKKDATSNPTTSGLQIWPGHSSLYLRVKAAWWERIDILLSWVAV